MGLAILAADELGMRPDEFAISYQDTDNGPYDGGSSGSQTTFNNGRAVVEAAREIRRQLLELAAAALEASVDDLELADGGVHVKGSPDRRVTIAELAATAHEGALLLARGSGTPPDRPAGDVSACVGRLGFETFAAPTYFCHAALVSVDPATGIARATRVVAATDVGSVINRTGAIGQVTGGVVMSLGNATLEGTHYGGDGRQRNPTLLDYKLLTSADAPHIEASSSRTRRRTAGRAARRASASRRSCRRPRAVANAIAAATGARVRRLPMTPERVWRADADRRRRGGGAERALRRRRPPRVRPPMTSRFAAPTTVTEALAILATDRSTPGRRRNRPRGRRAAGPEAPARVDRRDRPDRRAPDARAEEGGLVLGASRRTPGSPPTPDVRARLDRARRRGRDRRVARDARDRHDRREPDERIAGGRDDRAARRARRRRHPARPGRRRAPRRGRGSRHRTRPDRRGTRRAAHRGPGPAAAPGSGSAYIRLEYRRAMEIAVVGAAVLVTLRGDGPAASRRRPDRPHGRRADDRPGAGRRGSARSGRVADRGPPACRQRPRSPTPPRSTTSAPARTTAARCSRS